MSKIYNSNYSSQGFSINPTTAQPLDVRTVVESLDDLTNILDAAGGYSYPGMVVAVIGDTITNNGIYYKENNGHWKKIGEGSNTPIDFPENEGDYILHIDENGDYSWIEAQNSEFTFTAESPYLEGSGSGDGSEYTIVNDISSSTEMTIKNQYVHNGIKTADVVTVKDSETSFHLMLNPDIRYILFGGDSQGRERVVLNIQSPIVKSTQEIFGAIGLTWFISQTNLYDTMPVDADLYWYNSLADAQSDFESTHTHNIDPNDGAYNNVIVDNPLDVWCIAAKDGWLDSYIRQLHMEVINDAIQVNVSIVDITRTTANENVNN